MFAEYTPFTIPQESIKLRFTFIGEDKSVTVPPAKKFQKFLGQKSYEPTETIDLSSFGPTTIVPLGLVVHAR